ncbi:glycosyltransferase [Bacillus sp. TH25]|uniref:glycosyltransferase n=1 Tax=Bacillus sp. TH25 TaxID=2796391 RepID=UPI0019116B89|nr:glycosyltransferase [Bacillus sp. TH25]MBK5432913.1 glycosyltransferase [Bacillus sp. TH25]
MKNEILYVVMSDLDSNNINSGPSVRSYSMLKEFENLDADVDVVYGSNPKERYEKVKSLIAKKKSYKYCYIESRVGVTRFYDTLVLILLKNSIRPLKIGFYYRDMYWKYGINLSNGRLKQSFVPLMNKVYLKLIDNVCNVIYVQSEAFKEALQPLVKKADILLLPPGCEKMVCNDFTQEDAFYVGEIDSVFSGVELLIQAFEIINIKTEINLNLVCRKYEYEENLFLKEVNHKFNWLKISHHNKATIGEVYQRSKVAIIPRSGNEYTKLCLPIKLFEYISQEKPIVAVNHGETADFINYNKLGLLSNDTPESLASCILEMFNNDKLHAEFKMNIKEYKKNNLWMNRIEHINETLN